MHQTLERGTQRPTATVVWLMAALVLLLGLLAAANALLTGSSAAGPASSAQAALAPGTEGLLRQTASHLSKLLGGASVGGFPGFEPPDDDSRYKDRIRNQSYGGEEANYWAKEINHFLRSLADKNPGLTLEQILQRAGLPSERIDSFLTGLKDAYATIEALEGYGVTPETVRTLEILMKTLGVAPW